MAWDAIRDLRSWQERLARLAGPQPESWSPAIDVYETATSYVISAEVPGLTRDAIDIRVEEMRLSIRGQRADRSGAGGIVHFHQIERGHGTFARTFEFADQVDVDTVSADLADGVLTITLVKVQPPPARRIEVT